MTERRDDIVRTRGEAQDMRLRMGPDSWNEEARTLDITWSTGADVTRADPWSGARWTERLSMDPAHIRTDRVNSIGTLLDSHRSQGASNVLGNVVSGSVRIVDGLGVATVRLTDAPDVESTVRKIIDGSIRAISVGYRTFKETIETPADGLEIREAIDWEPTEFSIVPVPADAGAATRDLGRDDTQETPPMSTTIETPVIDLDAVRAEAASRAVEADRKRTVNIRSAASALGLADEADAHIAGKGDINAVRAMLIEKRAQMDAATATNGSIRIGESHDEKTRAGIENAIMHRAGVVADLTDAGRAHRHMTLIEMGKVFLAKNGHDVSRMTADMVSRLSLAPQRMQITTGYDGNIRALGGHTGADFPLLLANVATKFLLPGYAAEPLNFMTLVEDYNLPDFKTADINMVGSIPALTKKVEGAEYQYVTFGESREQFTLATYASAIRFTREMMINDDLGGLQRSVSQMGGAWARTQLDLFWAIVTANAAMADGDALFSANHLNVGTGAVLAKAPLAELRKLLRKAKSVETSAGLDDGQYLNLQATQLIVPSSLEETAETLLGRNPVVTSTVATAMPGWARQLDLIVEPRLDVASTTAYYLAAAGKFCARGLLGGSDAPFIDNMDDWDTDSVAFKVRGDAVFKAQDFRPITHNDGTP